MKKKLLISLLLLFLFTTFSQAQTKKGQFAISGNMGVSLLSWKWEYIIAESASTNVDAVVIDNAAPAFQGLLDYALLDKLSIGGAFSYQSVSNISKNNYVNTSGIIVTEDVVNTVTLMNFSYRILFHYLDNDKIDLYSGIRMGLNYYQNSNSSNDLNYHIDQTNMFNEFGFAPQVIGLGIRMYIFEDLAVNTEVAIGYPSFFSFGLTYRM